jgi:hypothetical protein
MAVSLDCKKAELTVGSTVDVLAATKVAVSADTLAGWKVVTMADKLVEHWVELKVERSDAQKVALSVGSTVAVSADSMAWLMVVLMVGLTAAVRVD